MATIIGVGIGIGFQENRGAATPPVSANYYVDESGNGYVDDNGLFYVDGEEEEEAAILDSIGVYLTDNNNNILIEQ
jgi:hypothetical protein